MKKGRGKRNIIFQMNSKDNGINATEIEKKIYQALKENGVKYQQDITYYINMEERKAYCVVDDNQKISIAI